MELTDVFISEESFLFLLLFFELSVTSMVTHTLLTLEYL